MSPKLESQKEALKSSDPSTLLLLTKRLMLNLNPGSEPTKGQLLFHSMREPLETCSAKASQVSVCLTEMALTFCSMLSLKVPRLSEHQENL